MELYVIQGRPTKLSTVHPKDTGSQKLVSIEDIWKQNIDYSQFEGIVLKREHDERRIHVSSSYFHIILPDETTIPHNILHRFHGEVFAGNLIRGFLVTQQPIDDIVKPDIRSRMYFARKCNGYQISLETGIPIIRLPKNPLTKEYDYSVLT